MHSYGSLCWISNRSTTISAFQALLYSTSSHSYLVGRSVTLFGLSTIILFAKCFNVTKWQSAFCWMPFPVSHTPGHLGQAKQQWNPGKCVWHEYKQHKHMSSSESRLFHFWTQHFSEAKNRCCASLFEGVKNSFHVHNILCSFCLLGKQLFLRNITTAKLNTH